jgi:phage head maturation protease
MPLPTPAADETEDAFVSRCMADETMLSEFPDESQRAAVCHRQFSGEEAAAPEDDGAKGLLRKELTCAIKAAGGRDPDEYVATITTDTVDMDGEVMVPEGMDATDFEKRRTIFWNHDYARPVAKALGKLKREDGRILSKFRFAERPAAAQGEWFPDTVRALVDQGVIRGVSIGFRPMEQRPPTKEDRRKYGEDCRLVRSRWKLGEWSIAPYQCNPDAVVDAIAKGVVSKAVAEATLAIKLPAMPAPKVELPPEPKRVRLLVMVADGPSTTTGSHDFSRAVTKSVAKALGLLYI